MTEKSIPDPGFAGDDGIAEATLADALARWAGGGEPAPVHTALAGARLLVPVVAVALELDATGAERTTDMALVTIQGADGRTALPAFTSLATLAAWNPDARPVPVEAAKAALATFAEHAHLLVLDAAGPVTFRVEGAALRALARGRAPLPAQEDPEVLAALVEVLATSEEIVAACLLPSAEGADAVLGLVLAAGAGDAAEVVRPLADALAAHPVLRERLDHGLDLAVLPANADLRAAPVVVLERRGAGSGLVG